MTILNICGFEPGDTSETAGLNGTGSVQGSTVRSGGFAFRANPATTGTGNILLSTYDATGDNANLTANTDRYVRFYFRYATKPSSNDEPIYRVLSGVAEGQAQFDVALNSAGKLAIYLATASGSSRTLQATGTTVLNANTWYRIEVKRPLGTTSLACEVKLNGVSEVTATCSPGTTTGPNVQFGKMVNYNGNTVDFFYDDIVLSDSGYPGDGAGLVLLPNANGNDQTWTIGAGSGSHFQVVDETGHNSDTDYLLSTLVSGNAEIEALTDSGTAGISGTINCAKSMVVARQDGASAGSLKLRLRSGSTNSDTASAITGGTIGTYKSFCRLYATDPATSAAWTTSGLDGAQVGAIEFSGANKSRMTWCGLYVDFLASATQDTPELYERIDTQMQQLLVR